MAYCKKCDKPLYGHPGKAGRRGPYYQCPKCYLYLRMQWLEETVENLLLFTCGDLEWTEMELVPGDDHQVIIHQLEREIDTLENISGTELVVAAKRAEIEHLSKLPYDPDHFEPIPKGISVRKHWEDLDYAERGTFLRTRNVRVLLDKHSVEFHGGWLRADAEAETHLLPLQIP